MTEEEIESKINTDPDFILSKRFDFSLVKFQEKYPEGAPTKAIAQALACSEAEIERTYTQILIKLRAAMKVR